MNQYQFSDFNYLSTGLEEENSVGDIFKIVFMGDSGVGKTNLMGRFSRNAFNINSKPTIGVDFALKNVKLGPYLVRLQLWDTAGQERYKSFTSTYFKDAQGIIFVYDITCKESFTNISNWLDNAKMHVDIKNCATILIGNKMDLESDRQVGTAEARDFAERNEMLFFETTALDNTDDCIGRAFYILINGIINRPSGSSPTKQGHDSSRQLEQEAQ
jgi:small GTP-binding protein